jgi:hypothetical protein
MLTLQLHELEEDGIVHREICKEIPPKGQVLVIIITVEPYDYIHALFYPLNYIES